MSLKDPLLVPKDALLGIKVGISVSDSADLGRLGLSQRHINLAAAEITRAVLLAGGTVVYGGTPEESGFTEQLMTEVARFGSARHSLTLCAPWPEWADRPDEELSKLDKALGAAGRLLTIDFNGNEVPWRDRKSMESPTVENRARAYRAARAYMTSNTDARITVGGRLQGYAGSMPGVVEEVLLAVEAGQPLYLAGGFGGAAAACARALDLDMLGWFPANLPMHAESDEVSGALEALASAASERGWSAKGDGLTAAQRALLCASHRPGEIASLAILGLAVRLGKLTPVETEGDNDA